MMRRCANRSPLISGSPTRYGLGRAGISILAVVAIGFLASCSRSTSPHIAFTASDASVLAGGEVTLSWVVSGLADGDTCALVGSPTGATPTVDAVGCLGSELVTILVDTSYYLQVRGAAGLELASARVDVTVREPTVDDGLPGDEEDAASTRSTIGPDGGSLRVEAGAFVDVPAGFLREPAELTLSAVHPAADPPLGEQAIAVLGVLAFPFEALEGAPADLEVGLQPLPSAAYASTSGLEVFATWDEREPVYLGTFEYRVGLLEVVTIGGGWLRQTLADLGAHGVTTLYLQPVATRGDPRLERGGDAPQTSQTRSIIEGLFAIEPEAFAGFEPCEGDFEGFGENVEGFTRVTEPTGSNRDAVVFIHGWQERSGVKRLGHPALCTRDELIQALIAPTCDPTRSSCLPELVEAYDFFSFGYDSRRRIAQIATDLEAEIGKLEHDRVLFVAHSMGGLVTHAMLQSVGTSHPLHGAAVLVKGAPLRGVAALICISAGASACDDSLFLGNIPVDLFASASDGTNDMSWEHGGVRYPRKTFGLSLWEYSVDNPFLRRLNGFLTSSDVASYHAFLGTRQNLWKAPTAARGMTSDGLVTYQSTCLSAARGIRDTADDVDNGCLQALMPATHIGTFGLDHSPLGGAENAAGIAAWLRARMEPEAVDQITLVGVVPGHFDTNGGEFTLTVSPRDASGDYVDVVLDLADFSLFGIEVLVGDAAIASGTASPTAVRRIAPGIGAGASIVLTLDSSGSMGWNDPGRLRVAAGKALVNRLQPGDEAAVLDFGASIDAGLRASRLLQGFTSDAAWLAAALERVSASGGTPLYGAILDAVSVAAGATNEDRAIVVFTDGEAGDQHLAATAVDAAVASGMPVFTIGLGSGVGTAALQDLAAATGGTFAEAADAGGLEAVFDAVGAGISGGRILVTARGSFAPPLTSAGRFVVRGTLRTHVPDGAFDTGFRFVVDVVEAD